MEKLFLPFAKNEPVVTEIKGHRLVIVSEDFDDMESSLETLGASSVIEIDMSDSYPDTVETMAEEVKASAVFAPPGVSVSAMILGLEDSLNWLH